MEKISKQITTEFYKEFFQLPPLMVKLSDEKRNSFTGGISVGLPFYY
jgi:hypothetical protein